MRNATLLALCLAGLATASCGSDTKTVTESVTVTQTEAVTETAEATEPETTSTEAAPASTPATASDIGKVKKSGGITLRVLSVRRASKVTYEAGVQSDVTPNGNARTVKAPQGGRYVFVKTRLTNNTSGGIDLTCGYVVDAKVFDENQRQFDPIDGLSQVGDNPECNDNVQPGFKTPMTFVYLLPKGTKAIGLAFADVTDSSSEPEAAVVRFGD